LFQGNPIVVYNVFFHSIIFTASPFGGGSRERIILLNRQLPPSLLEERRFKFTSLNYLYTHHPFIVFFVSSLEGGLRRVT
jgi:hypothetical protein